MSERYVVGLYSEELIHSICERAADIVGVAYQGFTSADKAMNAIEHASAVVVDSRNLPFLDQVRQTGFNRSAVLFTGSGRYGLQNYKELGVNEILEKPCGMRDLAGVLQKHSANVARILCVEDEKSVRTMIARYLKESGYEVVEAENGQEALQHLSSVHAVVSDIVMPVMNGIDFHSKKLERYDSEQLPFIYHTGTPPEMLDLTEERHALAQEMWTQAAAVFVKPLSDLETLTSAIESYIPEHLKPASQQ